MSDSTLDAARGYTDKLIADGLARPGNRESLAKKLITARNALFSGKGTSVIESRQTDFIRNLRKPFGWKRGMPGYLSIRERKSLPFLRRRSGRHATNWEAQKFIPGMAKIWRSLGKEPQPPYWNDIEGKDVPSEFSSFCDGWLHIVDPGHEGIPTQTYRDILKAIRERSN